MPAVVSGTGFEGFSLVDVSKALAAGLALRPIADTVAATLDWHAGRAGGSRLRAGLSPEREAEVLEAWHGRRGREGTAERTLAPERPDPPW